MLKDGKFVFDKKTLEAIDKVYAILEAVEPCGEDNRRELIYQSRILEAHSSYEYNVEELFVWMQDAVKKCIA